MKLNERMVRERLAYYEERAQAYRIILGDYTDQQTESKKQVSSTVFAKAIALDSKRRAGSKAPVKTPAKKRSGRFNTGWTERKIAERQVTKAWLDSFSHDEPRPYAYGGVNGGPKRIAPFIATGYLKKKGGGYVRTAKEFHPEKVHG